jgi:tetratricopeptide (TPR) repeat protein
MGYAPESRRSLPWVADLAARIISALLAQDRVDEALAISGEAREVFPHHPLVLLQSVAVHCRLLEEDTEQWAGASAEGLVTRCREDLDDILAGRTRSYGSAVDSRVRDLYPLRYLGSLALLEGRVSEAVGLFERALDLDPSYSYAWLGMAECWWRKVVDQFPEHPVVRRARLAETAPEPEPSTV